eukprot:3328324-Pyramimonas_sp.AAC.1
MFEIAVLMNIATISACLQSGSYVELVVLRAQVSISSRSAVAAPVFKVTNGSKVCMMSKFDKWAGHLNNDSDDQEDIARGRGM